MPIVLLFYVITSGAKITVSWIFTYLPFLGKRKFISWMSSVVSCLASSMEEVDYRYKKNIKSQKI